MRIGAFGIDPVNSRDTARDWQRVPFAVEFVNPPGVALRHPLTRTGGIHTRFGERP